MTWQNPGQYFIAQELKKKVELKYCGILVIKKVELHYYFHCVFTL